MVVPFWLMIVLFVVIGMMLANNYYWRNRRDEHAYRVRRWEEQQRESSTS
jgi:uncharacterized membrane protein